MNVDHEARATTIEISYNETGTLSEDEVHYLIGQARQAIALAKAGNEMAMAGVKFIEASDKAIEELEQKLLVSQLQVAILQRLLEEKEPAEQ